MGRSTHKLLYAGIVLLWAGCVFPAAHAQPQTDCAPTPHYQPIEQRAPKALLYRIQRCGYPESYIFGTFHSDAPALGALYHHAVRYLQRTRQLVLEVVLDDASSQTIRQILLAPQRAPNLSQQLGEEWFGQLQHTLLPRIGLSVQEAERYKPWAIAMMAQYPPAEDDGVVLDEKLQHYAAKWGIATRALETPQEQLAIFDHMPHPMQLDFLRATLEDADILDEQHKEIASYYEQQDVQAIRTMSDRVFGELAQRYPALADYIQQRVLIRRNKIMTTRILPLLRQSNFIAVGALHLPGDEGVLSLLEKRGYEIWPINDQQQAQDEQ